MHEILQRSEFGEYHHLWNHGAGRVRHGGDHSTVFVPRTTLEEKEACVSARNFTEKK